MSVLLGRLVRQVCVLMGRILTTQGHLMWIQAPIDIYAYFYVDHSFCTHLGANDASQ